MLEIIGLALGVFLFIGVIGIALKLLGFIVSLILLPLKLVFSLAGGLILGAFILLFLPVITVFGVVALVGGLAFLALGLLGAIFA